MPRLARMLTMTGAVALMAVIHPRLWGQVHLRDCLVIKAATYYTASRQGLGPLTSPPYL